MTQEILGSWDSKVGKDHKSFTDSVDFTSYFKHSSFNTIEKSVIFNVTLTEEKAAGSKVFTISAIVFVTDFHARLLA